MATITATNGIRTAFAGGADIIECSFTPAARKGVQIEADGFTLDAATVTAFGSTSTAGDAVSISEAKHIIVVGDDAIVGKIRISGVAAGSYNVTFIEI